MKRLLLGHTSCSGRTAWLRGIFLLLSRSKVGKTNEPPGFHTRLRRAIEDTTSSARDRCDRRFAAAYRWGIALRFRIPCLGKSRWFSCAAC